MAVTVVPKEEMLNHIGTKFEPSEWITVDQDRINTFADCTEDHQFIHIDEEKAAQTPFGGTIAHGFLTLSLASRFAYDCFETLPGQVMGVNYGFNSLRFLKPVTAGSRVRGRFVLKSIKQRNPTDLLRENTLTVDIEGSDTPALVADWLSLAVFAPQDTA